MWRIRTQQPDEVDRYRKSGDSRWLITQLGSGAQLQSAEGVGNDARDFAGGYVVHDQASCAPVEAICVYLISLICFMHRKCASNNFTRFCRWHNATTEDQRCTTEASPAQRPCGDSGAMLTQTGASPERGHFLAAALGVPASSLPQNL